jgi:3-oxoacyl-[acyl-carrier protein] reductase
VKLANRVAIVTGSSRGFGLAIALKLVAEGAHVVLTSREGAALDQASAQVLAARVDAQQRVLAIAGDVSRESDVGRMVQTVTSQFGQIDVLVCNAGVYGPMGAIEDIDWTEWVRAVEINLYGVVLCCRAVVPLMRRQGHGKIITLSGGGATQPLPRLSAYAATKAAVVRFSETLAAELAGSGITVNSVAPGALNTRLLDEVLQAGPDRVGAAFHARAVQQKAEGGTPLETGAELVAFLASDDSDGISGRLLSAVWDDWRSLGAEADRLATTDVFTLRRIVPADRGWSGSSS